ncbi:zinc finger domain-containing protein [Haloplanus halophilus]|uniref:zinc finger domain-containing protein n=1 Tax=Haloplanus halophilus TaxID=2949993 RepID=UPI00203EA446|nr:hypothetical protein [Haloplanus sp. GDY1]
MTVSCNRQACDRTWLRDPVLEVHCPSCGADIGTKCKRPSGHGGNFVHPHAARDRLAVAEGHYGHCPLEICAESLAEMAGGTATGASKGATANTKTSEASGSTSQLTFEEL